MSARFAVGFAALALAACYDVPQPACGFACGPPELEGGEGTCPSGYVCFTQVDNRCHRMSPPFTEDCPGDGGVPLDVRAPRVTGRTPAPDSSVNANSVIRVTFDERVTIDQDGLRLLVFEGGQNMFVPGSVFPEDGSIDGSVWQFTTNMSPPLVPDKRYTVELGQSFGVTDLAGNALSPESWSFTTGSNPSPMVISSVPASGDSGVSVKPTMQIVFSEAVFNVSDTTVRVFCNGTQFLASVTDAGQLDTWQVTPNKQLPAFASCSIELSNFITDMDGFVLAATFIPFQTGADLIAPNVVNATPTGTLVPVNADVLVTFDENVIGVSDTTITLRAGTDPPVAALVSYSTAQTRAALQPVSQLAQGIPYTITVTGLRDMANNIMATRTFSFTTTTDTIRPSFVTIEPTTGQSGVALTAVVRITFDEIVTGVDTTSFSLSASAPIPGTVTSENAGRTWVFTPTTLLPPNTMINVTLTTAVADQHGNTLAPFSGFFTTGP